MFSKFLLIKIFNKSDKDDILDSHRVEFISVRNSEMNFFKDSEEIFID